MDCMIVRQELTEDDYLLTIRRPDGSEVKVLIPREDCSDVYVRQCMQNNLERGLNLVTAGHYY